MKVKPPFKFSHRWSRGLYGTIHKFQLLILQGKHYRETKQFVYRGPVIYGTGPETKTRIVTSR
jgi:hypothetical protein